MGLISAVKGWLNGLFKKENIEKALDVKIATSQNMLDAQKLWRDVYAGRAPWNIGEDGVPSLFTAASICSRVAKTVTLELDWGISGSAMADYMKEQFAPFMAGSKNGLRHSVEKGCKSGKLLFLPAKRGGMITIGALENNYYYPIRYDEFGRLSELATQTQVADGNTIYTLLSRFDYQSGKKEMRITYAAFEARKNVNSGELGRRVPLSSVAEWTNLPPELRIANVARPWFTEFIMPQNNHIEENSPDGVAIFSKAVDLIRKLDMQKARTEWEYEGGELAVDVPADMWRDIGRKDPLNPRKGEVKLAVPKGKERLFRNNGLGSQDFRPTTFSPAFRNEALEAGSNAIKRDIEMTCELAFGTISDAAVQAKTATEIESSQVVTYSTIGDIQNAVGSALKEVAEIIREMAFAYGLAPWGEFEFALNWGDGIPEDDSVIFARTLQKLDAGLYRPEQALAVIDKITIEQARAALANVFEGG